MSSFVIENLLIYLCKGVFLRPTPSALNAVSSSNLLITKMILQHRTSSMASKINNYHIVVFFAIHASLSYEQDKNEDLCGKGLAGITP